MSLDEAVVEGTLRSDGTVELDQKPNLAPGRVTVVLRSHAPSPPPQEDWWQFLQRSRRELEASGAQFMNEAEVADHIKWLREGDAIDDMLREADAATQSQEHP
jgi:hypothetical protein